MKLINTGLILFLAMGIGCNTTHAALEKKAASCTVWSHVIRGDEKITFYDHKKNCIAEYKFRNTILGLTIYIPTEWWFDKRFRFKSLTVEELRKIKNFPLDLSEISRINVRITGK